MVWDGALAKTGGSLRLRLGWLAAVPKGGHTDHQLRMNAASSHFRLPLAALMHMHMLDADGLRATVPQAP